MGNSNNEGSICGMIFDAETGELLENVEVICLTGPLDIMMPLEKEGYGVYSASGKTGSYRIRFTAPSYHTNDAILRIAKTYQEQHIFLFPQFKQEQDT